MLGHSGTPQESSEAESNSGRAVQAEAEPQNPGQRWSETQTARRPGAEHRGDREQDKGGQGEGQRQI